MELVFPLADANGEFAPGACEVLEAPSQSRVDAQIRIFQRDDAWVCGWSARLPEGAGGASPNVNDSAFASRHLAIEAACEAIVAWGSEQKERGGKRHRAEAERLQTWALECARCPPAEEAPAAAVPAGGEIRMVPLAELRESPLNPRRYFPEAKMAELVTSMRQSGFRKWLPLLVRPAADGGALEIAAGTRRFRAARAAGLTEVPCLVRALREEEFLDVLNFDNSGREDVHPLDEASGWHEWMRLGGHGVQDIAARLGRSKEYVYQRLKYADLTEEAQRIFLDGKISAAHAVLIARLTPEQQAKALEYCAPPSWNLEREIGYRSLGRWIRGNFCTDLEGASFDRSDATLLPGQPACDACPKLGTNIPGYTSEFGQVDVCTDLRCFEAKEERPRPALSAASAVSNAIEAASQPATVNQARADQAPMDEPFEGDEEEGPTEAEREAQQAARFEFIAGAAERAVGLDRLCVETLMGFAIECLSRADWRWLIAKHGIQEDEFDQEMFQAKLRTMQDEEFRATVVETALMIETPVLSTGWDIDLSGDRIECRDRAGTVLAFVECGRTAGGFEVVAADCGSAGDDTAPPLPARPWVDRSFALDAGLLWVLGRWPIGKSAGTILDWAKRARLAIAATRVRSNVVLTAAAPGAPEKKAKAKGKPGKKAKAKPAKKAARVAKCAKKGR
jgi:ParB/RepB/Spo0J family partition protein